MYRPSFIICYYNQLCHNYFIQVYITTGTWVSVVVKALRY